MSNLSISITLDVLLDGMIQVIHVDSTMRSNHCCLRHLVALLTTEVTALAMQSYLQENFNE